MEVKSFNWMTLILIVVCGALIFAMGIVRGKCVSIGYEHSKLLAEIEKRRIIIERIDEERTAMVSKDKLFPIAIEKGFIMMKEGKTFNVQR